MHKGTCIASSQGGSCDLQQCHMTSHTTLTCDPGFGGGTLGDTGLSFATACSLCVCFLQAMGGMSWDTAVVSLCEAPPTWPTVRLSS